MEKTNFLLQHMLPVYFLTEQNVLKATESQFFDRHGKAVFPPKDTTPTEHGTLINRRLSVMTGSCAEGLAVPDHFREFQGRGRVMLSRDRDEMTYTVNRWWFEDPSEECIRLNLQEGTMFQVESLGGNSGANYARLKITPEYRSLCDLVGWNPRYDYLFNTTVVNHAMQCFSEAIVKLRLEDDNRSLDIHGPCATHVQTTPLGEPITYTERDLCLCLGMHGWPQAAQSWPTRTRRSRWPSEQDIQEILGNGFHMVPVGRRNVVDSKFEWRYSFSIAEKTLAHSLSDVQRAAYIYLKLLHTHYFKEPGVLPTYCLKTLMFWLCERRPKVFWRASGLAEIVQYILSEIIHALAKLELPHYFIPQANLLEQVHPLFTRDVMKKVVFVKRNLMECLLQLDDRIIMVCLMRPKMRAILGDISGVKYSDEAKTSALKALVRAYVCCLDEQQGINLSEAESKLIRATNIERFFQLLSDVLRDLHQMSKGGDFEQFATSELLGLCLDFHTDNVILLALLGLAKVDLATRTPLMEILSEAVRGRLLVWLELNMTASTPPEDGERQQAKDRRQRVRSILQMTFTPYQLVFPNNSCKDLHTCMLELTFKRTTGVALD